MVGGIGQTTFVANITNPSVAITDLIKNFRSGDDAIIRGLTPADFSLNSTDSISAFGSSLTLGITPNSNPTGPSSAVTFTGFSTTDLSNGRLSASFGTDPQTNVPFLLVHAN